MTMYIGGPLHLGMKHCEIFFPHSEYQYALLESKLGTAERCLLTAGLYGDQREVAFWTVALYYLLREKNRRQDPLYSVHTHHIITFMNQINATCTGPGMFLNHK